MLSDVSKLILSLLGLLLKTEESDDKLLVTYGCFLCRVRAVVFLCSSLYDAKHLISSWYLVNDDITVR